MSACGGSGGEGATASPPATAAATVVPQTAAPTAQPSPTSGDFQYVVQDGDTPGGIADLFGITLEELLVGNGLGPDAVISVGDVLLIVGAEAEPLHTPEPTIDPSIISENPVGTGWLMPVEGACLPSDPNQMPNVPREYRFGVHEGVDFFTGFACVDVSLDTPALAARGGRVIRSDQDYNPMTQQELNTLLARSATQGYTDEGALDRFRGRQVWIDHGDGIVTRYCHLNSIPDEILAGTEVAEGQVVGYIGDSGTPEAITNPGFEIHLHFELRIGNSYLGAGLEPLETKALYQNVFFRE